ncbi:MAG: ComEC family competence protein, partial [Planctomycetaceae bacterium]|nr:ComEC family competence protein [Planctomycetaceae bacterium]
MWTTGDWGPMSDVPPPAGPMRPGIGRRVRAPVLPFTTALVAGIVLDWFADCGTAIWLATAVIALLVSRVGDRRGAASVATVALLIACGCVGGLRHQLCWSVVGPCDISHFLDDDPIRVKLVGVIDSPVTIRPAPQSDMTPSWMQIDRSQCDLHCERIIGANGDVPVTGRVRVIVTGHVLHATVGDRVEVLGRLMRPRGSQNPGGFDYRTFLRQEGIRSVLDVNHPEAVRRLEANVSAGWARGRARLRAECERMLVQNLSPQAAPLAVSLLLGERSALPQETRDAFVESGTVHVLAISGLHVGILAVLLLVMCRLLNTSTGMTTLIVLLGIAAYACITNHRPPVIRASVLAATLAAGWPWFRTTGGANLLAFCGAVVLLMNPTDLFDIGTQLSFLSVMAIGWGTTVVAGWTSNPWRSTGSDWLWNSRGMGVPTVLRWLIEGYFITAAIWLFTAPLVAARFHLVAPVGLLLNVLLLPFVSVVLWLGFATVFCGLLAPWVVRWPAAGFDWSLGTLQDIVSVAARSPIGAVCVSGPGTAW